MIKEVMQKGADILRVQCDLVTDFKQAQEVIQDLEDTIDYLKTTYPFARGIGLAAPQIGVSLRISVLENDRGTRFDLINPEIIGSSEIRLPIREGCISFLQYRGMVPRYEWVKVRALDRNGSERIIRGEGDFAMLLQHETDHLNGVLMFDHLPNGEVDLYIP